MNRERKFGNILWLASVFFLINNCAINNNESGISKTLEPVEEVVLLPGGENTTVTVHKNYSSAYFDIDFGNIKQNNHLQNGTHEGWCINWIKPIDSNGGTYDNIKLYSTYRVKKWERINYLLNIQEDLKAVDPDLSWREIQLAIWSLRTYPEFKLDSLPLEDLPSSMRMNGKPNFRYERVRELLKVVNNGFASFDFSDGTKFAVIVETPVDVQTLITVVK